MLAQLAYYRLFLTGCAILGFLGLGYTAVRMFRKEQFDLGIICILLSFLGLIAAAIHGFPPSIYQEVSPGVYLTQWDSNPSTKDIPKNVDTIYEYGDPKESGYAVRWWRWVKVVRINDPYDWRVTKQVYLVLDNTATQTLLARGIAKKHDTERCLGDSWWRQEHPGKPQSEITFLETPAKGSDAPIRLHTLVFDG